MRLVRSLEVAGVPAAVLLLACQASADEHGEFFEARVRPLLSSKCFACHTGAAAGGLRLDSRESLLKGGASGPAIMPGSPEDSVLLPAVSHSHARLKMPPGGKLEDHEIATLAKWVKDGAVWPGGGPVAAAAGFAITSEQRAFWPFQAPRAPRVPAVKQPVWAGNPIDRFIRAKLEEKGLAPAMPADRRTLIRRVTYDLTGLPPTPEEVDMFLADRSPDAFAKVLA